MDENVIFVITNTDGSVREYEFADVFDYSGSSYAVFTSCNGLRIMEVIVLEASDFKDVSIELAREVVEIYKERRLKH